MLSAIIYGVLSMLLVVLSENMLENGKADVSDKEGFFRKIGGFFQNAGVTAWGKGFGVGAVVGLIVFFTPRVPVWLAWLFLIIVVALHACLFFRWKQEGSRWYEWLVYFILIGLWRTVLQDLVMIVTNPWVNAFPNTGVFWQSVVQTIVAYLIPCVVSWAILVDWALFRRDNAASDKDARGWHEVSWVFRIIAAIVILLTLFFTISWKSLPKRGAVPSKEVEEVVETEIPYEDEYETGGADEAATVDWTSYNLALQNDGDAKNDLNFGYDLKEVWKGKNNPIALEYFEDFMMRLEGGTTNYGCDTGCEWNLELDPVLGAATFGYHDLIYGSEIIGRYSEPNQAWLDAMNEAADRYILDLKDPDGQGLYFDALQRYREDIAGATVYLATMNDAKQLFMDPETYDDHPDIIMKGWSGQYLVLVVEYQKDGKTYREIYRTDCGYQPFWQGWTTQRVTSTQPPAPAPTPYNPPVVTNPPVIPTPTPAPTPTPEPGGSDPTPNPTPAPTPSPSPTPRPSPSPTPRPQPSPNPSPQPTSSPRPSAQPEPSNPKDPTRGTDVGTNDNPGPGEDTNNGYGAQYSRKDDETHSSHQTQEEFVESQEELITNPGRDGGEPNTPSYTPPTPTTPVGGTTTVTVDNDDANTIGSGSTVTPQTGNEASGTPLTSGNGEGGHTDDKGNGLDGAWGGPPD